MCLDARCFKLNVRSRKIDPPEVDRVAKKLTRTHDQVTRIMAAALFISEVSGRSGARAQNLLAQCASVHIILEVSH